MKNLFLPFYVAVAILCLFISCSSDEDADDSNATDAVDTVSAIDAGNVGNSQDIYVRLSINPDNITKIRVIIVPAAANSTFTKEIAEGLSAGLYQDITNLNQNTLIFQLASDLKDANGNAIVEDMSYVIRFLTFNGTSSNLSNTSSTLTLTDANPILGSYTGTWNDNIYTDFEISFTLTSGGNQSAQGAFYYSSSFGPCCGNTSNDGTISFSNVDFDTNEIGSFTYNQVLANFQGGQCNGTYTGENGRIQGLTLSIDFTGDDCEGPHTNGALVATRLIQ